MATEDKMQLHAWLAIGKNPCDDPPVKVSIAPVEKQPGVFPWIMEIAQAKKMFGQVVMNLTPEPQIIKIGRAHV